MAEPVDLIIPMLREMRSENIAMHEHTQTLIAAREKRVGAVETAQVSYRAALSADSLLSKLVTGEFEERIEALETRLHKLESRA